MTSHAALRPESHDRADLTRQLVGSCTPFAYPCSKLHCFATEPPCLLTAGMSQSQPMFLPDLAVSGCLKRTNKEQRRPLQSNAVCLTSGNIDSPNNQRMLFDLSLDRARHWTTKKWVSHTRVRLLFVAARGRRLNNKDKATRQWLALSCGIMATVLFTCYAYLLGTPAFIVE